MGESVGIATQRDPIFDVLKGIGIVAVLCGHSGLWIHFVLTFHMPLFFFVAGYFFKQRPPREELRLGVTRLIVPYVFISLCVCAIVVFRNLLQGFDPITPAFQDFALAHLFAFRNGAQPGWAVCRIDIAWFLCAMFWARLIVSAVLSRFSDPIAVGIVLVLGGFAANEVYHHIPVPFCLAQGLGAAGYLYAGFRFGQLHRSKPDILVGKRCSVLVICLLLWIDFFVLTGKTSFLNLALCRYPAGYVSSIVSAACACFCIHQFVASFYRSGPLPWKVLLFFGRYSLIAYCVHAIENYAFGPIFYGDDALFPSLDPFAILGLRLCFVTLGTLLILHVRPLKEQIFLIR